MLRIATKMKRTITTLKKDRIVSSGGTISSRIDVDLDVLVDENVRLQDEEQKLMRAVQKLQAKRKAAMAGHSSTKKHLVSTMDKGKHKGSRSRSPAK